MSTRKSTFFYGVLIGIASLVVGMVIASRLDLAPRSMASPIAAPVANSAPLTGPLDATTFRTLARDAGPAVVSIKITAARQSRSIEDFFDFGGGQAVPRIPGRGQNPRRLVPPQETPVEGAGSGFIIDKSGLVLTNNHVVADARTIEVHLAGMDDLEEGLPAKLVGRDELTDTALIQITDLPKEPLTVAKFGDSSQLARGDWVMAIGNPFALSNTVTVGIVSAVGRQTPGAAGGRYEEMIQTDAAINRGNSGGPLLNIRGEVVGINTKIVTEEGTGNVGVGFALPINTVREILPQLSQGKVSRGLIGVTVFRTPLTAEVAESFGLPNGSGAIVKEVTPGGPAFDAGIKAGDVIVEFNGKPVHDNNELVAIVTRTTPNTSVPVKIYRNKKATTVNIKVEELNLAEEQVQNALEQQKPEEPSKGTQPKQTGFGMFIDSINPQNIRELNLGKARTGAVITQIDPFGAAAQGGLQPGDVIVSVGGQAVTTVDQASAALDKVPAGRTAQVIVQRGGQESLFLVKKR